VGISTGQRRYIKGGRHSRGMTGQTDGQETNEPPYDSKEGATTGGPERSWQVGDEVRIWRNQGWRYGVVVAVRGGKYPYRVRYSTRTRGDKEVWAFRTELYVYSTQPRTELVSAGDIAVKIASGQYLTREEFLVAKAARFYDSRLTYEIFTVTFYAGGGYLCPRVAETRTETGKEFCTWGVHASEVDPAKLTPEQVTFFLDRGWSKEQLGSGDQYQVPAGKVVR